MAGKPKMAQLNPSAAAEVAMNGTTQVPAPLVAIQPVKPAPQRVSKPSAVQATKAEQQDRLYVYVSPAMAKTIRVHCAGERVSQSDFAREAFARELKRLGLGQEG